MYVEDNSGDTVVIRNIRKDYIQALNDWDEHLREWVFIRQHLLKYWVHRHEFRPHGTEETQVYDRIWYAHHKGFKGIAS